MKNRADKKTSRSASDGAATGSTAVTATAVSPKKFKPSTKALIEAPPAPVLITHVVEPGRVNPYGCSPPGYSCMSYTAATPRLWRRAQVSINEAVIGDQQLFSTNADLEYVEDWIVQLIERELLGYLQPPEGEDRIKVSITAPHAEAITQALIVKANSFPSDGGCGQG